MLDWISINYKNSNYYLNIPADDASNKKTTPLEEGINTVNYICKHYPAPYILYVSGGIDSQAMLWAWHNSGREYQAVSYTYNKDMNLHDLDAGMPQFASKHKIKIQRRDIDLLTFYQKGYDDYRTKYRCGSPHVCAYMYMADQQKTGTVIFSGCANILFDKFYTKNEWGLYHYSSVTKKPIVPFFFSETKSLHYAFKFNPLLSKLDAYLKGGYPVIPQSTIPNKYGLKRFSGFEQFKDYYDEHFSHLVTPKLKLQKDSQQKSIRTYDILLRNCYELKYLDDKYYVKFQNT